MTRTTYLALALSLGLVVAGCPDSRTSGASGGSVTPQPVASPAPTPAEPVASATSTGEVVPSPKPPTLSGSWSVSVQSEPPGINPDMFDTPEKKAKVFFDHHAVAADGKVTVAHKILNTTSEVDPDAAGALDVHMTGVDWEGVMNAAQKDGATEGGTVFKFKVTVGQASWDIVTTNIEKHPDLMKVVDAVKAATGKP